MKCKSLYEYNRTLDLILGPHDQMQTLMARSLYSKFKQPIYINFDTNVTKSLLLQSCTKLHDIGFNVVGCVSDNGGDNVGLWSECNVNFEKPFIEHPETGEKIFMFSDVPHLLKLLRNWFIDGGFLLEDGTELNQFFIRKIVKVNCEISPTYKLSLKHLEVKATERQNVRLAAELFSHSVAKSIQKMFPNDNDAKKLAEFIDLVNSWFDIMNSYSLNGIGYKKPYGMDLTEQNKILGSCDYFYSNVTQRFKLFM